MRLVAIVCAVFFACGNPVQPPSSARLPAVTTQPVTTTETVAMAEPNLPIPVTDDVVAPVLIRRVEPDYPRYPGRYRLGIVLLQCVVTESGDVRDLRVVRGPGNSFETAVVDAVNQWKFQPATRHGKPVAVIYDLTVGHVPYRPALHGGA